MASYTEARAQRFTAAGTVTITGVALEAPQDSVGARTPILRCECFAAPCECDGPIIWIDEADFRQRTATDRRSKDGEELYEFKIDLDATVLVESVARAKAGELTRPRTSFGPTRPGRLPAKPEVLSARAPGSHYSGQVCSGHTVWEVWTESDGVETTEYYVAVGSC